MGDIVNLKRFKKRSEREQAAKQADANRTRFGRTKPERTLDELRAQAGKTSISLEETFLTLIADQAAAA